MQRIRPGEEYKRLFENFVYLSALQIVNYILPLMTFPYLVRVLGVEKFGLLSFANATIGYFQMITDYGFNLSATREIAIHRGNKGKVEEIFSAVMIIRLALMILSLILLTALVIFFEKFRRDWPVYYLTFGMVVGNVLFPVWFFQGMEKMKYITFLNVLARGLFTVAIFIFVKEQADYWKVPLIQSLGNILSGILSLQLVRRSFRVRFVIVGTEVLKYHLFDSFHLFLSFLAIVLFNDTNVIVLGLLTNDRVVGYYSAASRAIGILTTLQAPFVNSIFPMVSEKIKMDFKNTFHKLKKIRNIGVVVYLVVLTIIGIFSENIILIVFGDNYKACLNPFLIMLYVPLVVFAANIHGNQILITLGKYNLFSNSLLFTGILNLIMVVPLSVLLKENGAALARTISELVLFYMLYRHSEREIYKFLTEQGLGELGGEK